MNELWMNEWSCYSRLNVIVPNINEKYYPKPGLNCYWNILEIFNLLFAQNLKLIKGLRNFNNLPSPTCHRFSTRNATTPLYRNLGGGGITDKDLNILFISA